jgi:Ca2+-binding RTX toxin-like protein
MAETALQQFKVAFDNWRAFLGDVGDLSSSLSELLVEVSSAADKTSFANTFLDQLSGIFGAAGYVVSAANAKQAIANANGDPGEVAAQVYGFFIDTCFQVLSLWADGTGLGWLAVKFGLVAVQTTFDAGHVKEGAMDEIRYLVDHGLGFDPNSFSIQSDGSNAAIASSNHQPSLSISTGSGNDTATFATLATSNWNAGAGTDRLVADLSGQTVDIGTFFWNSGSYANGFTGTGSLGQWQAWNSISGISFSGVEALTITTGSGNDTLVGSDFADVFTGNAGNDVLFGMGGNDTLDGGDGDDSLIGGDGNDIITGGTGDDSIDTGNGIDWADGGNGVDSINFDRSAATMAITFSELAAMSATGFDFVDGTHIQNFEKFYISTGAGDDTANFATLATSNWNAGSGTDRLVADLSAQTVDIGTFFWNSGSYANGFTGTGSLGQWQAWNSISGISFSGVEALTITTGSGNDYLVGGDFADVFTSNAGNDILYGMGGNDILDGGDGDDSLIGGDGTDTITGDAGDDSIDTGNGVDWADGGSGTDSINFDRSAATAAITFNELAAMSASGFDFVDGTHILNFEKFYISTGSGDDTANFATLATSNWNAGSGTDRLVADLSAQTVDIGTFFWNSGSYANGFTGTGSLGQWHAWNSITGISFTGVEALTITTGSGNDYLVGGDFADVFTGNAGNDVLFGMGGNDILNGGDGNDYLDGGGGTDQIYGGAGDDRLVFAGASSGNIANGGSGTDTLIISGSVSFSTLTAIEAIELTAGANLTLTTSQLMAGLAPNTELSGSGTITVNLEANVFTAMTSFQGVGVPINFVLNGSSGDDYIKAAHFNNTINGGTGRDFIRGGNGVDTIDGGADNDKITGWGGADILTGGSGSDQFRYFYATDSGTGAAADRITDFTIGSDVIDLRLLDKDLVTPDIQNYTLSFIGTSAFGAGGVGQIRYASSGSDMLVQFDLDGNGTSDMEIVLQGLAGQTLSVNDFLFGTNPTGGSEALSGMAASEPANTPPPDLTAALAPSGAALVPIDTLRASPVSVMPIELLNDPMALPGHELGFSLTQHANLLHLV